MELEREPQRKTTPHLRPSTKPSIAEERTLTAKFDRVSYAREATYALGAIFITIGLVGFVVDNLLAAHLSYAHNWIHLISGIVAITCAYLGRAAAQRFALGFGAFYGLLGILGFVLGTSAEATVGHTGRDASLWILSPGVLELGTSDHLLHIGFAAILLASALVHRQRRKDEGLIYH
ncbi:hypothetical protein AZI86_01840 [Bdellovibrio bacteriovorus]|uniref:DUF4383 domain-containing protein n=1 Tax=Bdellovibrio bacteriovorus TaxID=959 RepID=A0A150WN50_BDEBC|nr:DUF4383 domain-containing protein [Bdellovibrio bacteriovorus]KYG65840.1 hypothetical protein AZI86_01840 [Bdellovibrio bacteriovorus]